MAHDYLVKNGFEILETNWRFSKAEIDIICKKEELLVFVEVKTRSNCHFGAPEEFIDDKKIGLITDAAGEYMKSINHEWECRFDVISIIWRKTGSTLKHLEDAFFAGLE